MSFVKVDRIESLLEENPYKTQWISLADTSKTIYPFYQTSIWLDYSLKRKLKDYVLYTHLNKNIYAVRILDKKYDLTGILLFFFDEHKLQFKYRSRKLFNFKIPIVRVLGGEPLISRDRTLYEKVVHEIFGTFPDVAALKMTWIQFEGPLWDTFRGLSVDKSSTCSFYSPDDFSTTHNNITLYSSFDDHLSSFNHKFRYNLRQTHKKLKNYCDGRLDLVRFECLKDVEVFLRDAHQVSLASWQHQKLGPQMLFTNDEIKNFQRFAEERVLRSYILYADEVPIAYVRGFQFGDVYYYSRSGYDATLKNYAPGKVLFYLLLQDIYDHRPPKLLNFQEGDYDFKKDFATDKFEKKSILLIKRNLPIRFSFIIFCHKKYYDYYTKIKKIVKSVRCLILSL